MSITSAQGATVTFGGVSVGKVKALGQKFSCASPVDFTSIGSVVVGSGGNSRVIRRIEPAMIEPGEVSVRVWGVAPYSRADIGTIATLSVSVAGTTLTKTAYLADVDLPTQVGELVESTLTFQLTGYN